MHQHTNRTADSQSSANEASKKDQETPLQSIQDNRPDVGRSFDQPSVPSNPPVQMKSHVVNKGQVAKFGHNKQVVVGGQMKSWLDPADPLTGQSAGVNRSQNKLMAHIKSIYPLAKGALSVKGHLLNDNLGGTALDNNLFPISKGANGKHLATAENFVKNAVWQKKKPVIYTVDVKGSTDFRGADNDNKLSKFICSVYDWQDVNDINKQGPKIYQADVLSHLGQPKLMHATGMDDKPIGNISTGKLKKPREPKKAVVNLTDREKELRKVQPQNVIREGNDQYGANVNDKTTIDTSTDQDIFDEGVQLFSNDPLAFIAQYENDECMEIIRKAVTLAKPNDVSAAQVKAEELGYTEALFKNLPNDLVKYLEENSAKLSPAVLKYVAESYEGYLEDLQANNTEDSPQLLDAVKFMNHSPIEFITETIPQECSVILYNAHHQAKSENVDEIQKKAVQLGFEEKFILKMPIELGAYLMNNDLEFSMAIGAYIAAYLDAIKNNDGGNDSNAQSDEDMDDNKDDK